MGFDCLTTRQLQCNVPCICAPKHFLQRSITNKIEEELSSWAVRVAQSWTPTTGPLLVYSGHSCAPFNTFSGNALTVLDQLPEESRDRYLRVMTEWDRNTNRTLGQPFL